MSYSWNPSSFGMDLGASDYNLGSGGGAKKGGGGLFGMDPLSLGLGAANIGVSIWQGINQRNAAANTLDMQKRFARGKLDAARDRLANEVQMFRDGTKFAEASKIGDRVAGYGYGADLNFGRQLEGQRLARTELADLDFANSLRMATADRDFQLSGASQRVKDLDSRRRMKEALVGKLAAGRGMFGPIAPIDLNQMVI